MDRNIPGCLFQAYDADLPGSFVELILLKMFTMV